MLIVRQEQIEVLAASKRSRFKAKMIAHFQKADPSWSAGMGVDSLERFVEHGIRQSKRYGLGSEKAVARYLQVMKQLGQDFDQSPEYPWAQSLLTSKIPVPEKMDRLRDAVDYHFEARRIRNAR